MKVIEGKIDGHARCPDCVEMREVKEVDGIHFMLACDGCGDGIARLSEDSRQHDQIDALAYIIDENPKVILGTPPRTVRDNS